MRIIDADSLKQKVSYQTRKIVDQEPTAYDVNKVVEELEELKERIITNDYDGCATISGCPYKNIDCDRCQQIIVSDKAIEIVKAGGKNDD